MRDKNKPMDMNKKVLSPRFYLLPIAWAAGLFYRINGKVRYYKHGFKNFKEPSLILCNHASMIDMANVVNMLFPRSTCWIASIEEFQGREWIFRHLGVYPKRKFTSDMIIIKRTAELIRKRKKSVCIFPEARFSLAGITEDIGSSIGKMVKLCKCRVIVVNQKGNYLRSPQWAKHPYRNNKTIVDATMVCSAKEAETLDANIIQKRIEDAFVYDEYKWQLENNIKIRCKKNAENIHKILYKCPICKKEGFMNSKNNDLWCENCNTKWHQNQYGEMINENGTKEFNLVSDWYRWEREECIKEVNEGTYHFEDDVRIEYFVNAKARFKPLGIIHMIQNNDGITLKGTLDDGSEFDLTKPALSTRSIHIEYDYKHRGDAIDIATLDKTWFVFPVHKCCLTKFNFATEAIYDINKNK